MTMLYKLLDPLYTGHKIKFWFCVQYIQDLA